jgi:hypothetical protein
VGITLSCGFRGIRKRIVNVFIYLLFIFVVLRFELRVFTLSHQSFFVKGFFEIGSCELFARTGFEP